MYRKAFVDFLGSLDWASNEFDCLANPTLKDSEQPGDREKRKVDANKSRASKEAQKIGQATVA